MTIYKSSAGVTLEILRVPRSLIDAYARDNPTPEPPTIEVQVFGGVKEKMDDFKDPGYLAELTIYHLRMARLMFDLIVQAVNIINPDWRADSRIADMASLGIPIDSTHDYLRYIALAEQSDLTYVMEEALYLSTVTDRGIQEARQAFNIEWQGIPIDRQRNPPGKLSASSVYQSRVAASSLGYIWEQFCKLSGPDQSAIVAQYQCALKIEYLASEERRT